MRSSAATLGEPEASYAGLRSDEGSYEAPTVAAMWSPRPVPRAREEWAKIARRLEELRHLENCWDGEGASAPAMKALGVTLALLQEIESGGAIPPTAMAPTVVGGVLLEWRMADTYLEVEISDRGAMEWMKKNPDGSVDMW